MGARALEVRLSEVIGALSFALDLADGHALGHSVRSCAIGMRLAAQIGLDDERSSALYYGLLLKDAGCSANASQFAALYRADDRAVKRKAMAVDYTRPAEALRYIWGAVGGQGLGRVANAVRASTVGVRKVRELTDRPLRPRRRDRTDDRLAGGGGRGDPCARRALGRRRAPVRA